MMKYAVNHYENFTNPYAAFLFGLLQTSTALAVEFNVMLILTNIPSIINVIVKYVSLSSIANVPRFYFASLTSEHIMIKANGLKLEIKNYRKSNPLKNAPCPIYILRFIYKAFRVLYASVSYYFMPFCVIFFNFRFMINECKCWNNTTLEHCKIDDLPECPDSWLEDNYNFKTRRLEIDD